jgi:hypothetical protein
MTSVYPLKPLLLCLFDQGIGVNGLANVDLQTTRFQGLSRPDIADAGEVVGMLAIQQNALSPA